MKTSPAAFKRAIAPFPKLLPILQKLDDAGVPYIIGGSVALYSQGNSRLPHDVDVMFVNEAHEAANEVLGIPMEIIERPNVSMQKSTPVDDGSIDFLSHYTVILDGKPYHTPPVQKVPVEFDNRQFNLIPAEKIVAIKLIGRREHHHDLDDVKELLNHPDFDKGMFWEMVDLLQAREGVADLLAANHISI